ncbi:MAG: AlpA family phage regulatory protein [Balneolaceae bacterium]
MNNRIIRFPELCQILGGVSRQTIYDMVKRGDLPQSFKISPKGRAVGWLESDIKLYLEQQKGSIN